MADKIYNKVVYGGKTLIDLTGDTVEADKILSGYTAHDKSGAAITGSCAFDANTSDATAAASEILNTKTAYVAGAKVTGSMPNRGKQTSTITTKAQSVTINSGYHDGSGSVSISSTEQAKIVASNILSGVTILGVTGNVQPSSDVKIESSKTATPSTSQQTITPSSGFNALAQVVVNAIPYSETLNAQGGYTATIG
ncbi:MAG: hypothetical protein MJZ12_01645 [Prevotella sp.]|nr:hypothetical protein [Prevotella sp.]